MCWPADRPNVSVWPLAAAAHSPKCGILALLLLFQVVRGSIQPVVLSLQARAAGRHQQGAVVGLRHTGQRLTSIVIPPLMGGIADGWRVGESFIILGGRMLLLCIPLADHPPVRPPPIGRRIARPRHGLNRVPCARSAIAVAATAQGREHSLIFPGTWGMSG
jgi:hypothetical protein